MAQYTPTETRILALLSDGRAHSRQSLWDCLNDELACAATLRTTIYNLRKKLPNGHIIVCETTGRATFYRHCRMLCSPID